MDNATHRLRNAPSGLLKQTVHKKSALDQCLHQWQPGLLLPPITVDHIKKHQVTHWWESRKTSIQKNLLNKINHLGLVFCQNQGFFEVSWCLPDKRVRHRRVYHKNLSSFQTVSMRNIQHEVVAWRRLMQLILPDKKFPVHYSRLCYTTSKSAQAGLVFRHKLGSKLLLRSHGVTSSITQWSPFKVLRL